MTVLDEPRRRYHHAHRPRSPLGPRASEEERSLLEAFERIRRLQHLGANALAVRDDLRAAYEQVLEDAWSVVPPVRVSVAADLLGVDVKTIRAWIRGRVLDRVADTKVVSVTPQSLYRVLDLVTHLREAGQTRGLLEAVSYRLRDAEEIDNPMLQESMRQALAGDVRPLEIPEEYRHLMP